MRQQSTYLVKEIFGPTLQGEGAHAGRPCVFLRFAVCNLACAWCDTDFSAAGAERLSPDEITRRLVAIDRFQSRMVVVTGGEPTLQWDPHLAGAIRGAGFAVHMESNGTRVPAAAVDWLTISPKPQFHDGRFELAPAEALRPSEIKLVVDDTVTAESLTDCARLYPDAQRFLQPCMDERYDHHLCRTLALIERAPSWRLSLQIHKIVGLP